MNKSLIYSILQYRHSLALGEILNVGILFYFPEEYHLELAVGDSTRINKIYPNFNKALFNTYINTIKDNIKDAFDLFSGSPQIDDFFSFIHKSIFAEDAAGLVFSKPSIARNIFPSKEIAVEEYSQLFLPGVDIVKPKIEKRNEIYIIREFSKYILDKVNGNNEFFKNHFQNDVFIKTNHFEHKFNYSWNSSHTINYIKPISFDLSSEVDINSKAAQHVGYLTDLQNHGVESLSFNFLIAPPYNSDLNKSYLNALDFINSVKIPKQLIFEDGIDSFTQKIISELE